MLTYTLQFFRVAEVTAILINMPFNKGDRNVIKYLYLLKGRIHCIGVAERILSKSWHEQSLWKLKITPIQLTYVQRVVDH